jgi:hypothetical protein
MNKMKFTAWKELTIEGCFTEEMIDNIFHSDNGNLKRNLKFWLKVYSYSRAQTGSIKITRIQVGDLGIYRSSSWHNICKTAVEKGLTLLNIGTVPFVYATSMNECLKERTYLGTNIPLTHNGSYKESFVLEPIEKGLHLDTYSVATIPSKGHWQRGWEKCHSPRLVGHQEERDYPIQPYEYFIFIKS